MHVESTHKIYVILTIVLNKNDKLDIYYVEFESNGIIFMTKISFEILYRGKINYELQMIINPINNLQDDAAFISITISNHISMGVVH